LKNDENQQRNIKDFHEPHPKMGNLKAWPHRLLQNHRCFDLAELGTQCIVYISCRRGNTQKGEPLGGGEWLRPHSPFCFVLFCFGIILVFLLVHRCVVGSQYRNNDNCIPRSSQHHKVLLRPHSCRLCRFLLLRQGVKVVLSRRGAIWPGVIVLRYRHNGRRDVATPQLYAFSHGSDVAR